MKGPADVHETAEAGEDQNEEGVVKMVDEVASSIISQGLAASECRVLDE